MPMALLRSAIAFLMVLAGLSAAPQPALAAGRVALVIGNGAYQHSPPLANPLSDAKVMAGALQKSGFEVVEALDADKRKLDGALRSFAEKLNDAEVALFFYAGHGLQVGGRNFLVPTDAKLERERDLEFEAVSLDFVMRQMEIDREGRTSIVILDACRDNPLARNLARSMGTRSASVGRGLAPASTGLGTFIAYATQPGNVALDGDAGNSPFTGALAREMLVPGRNLNATMIEVRKAVVAATGGRQVPWDHSAMTGDFYFLAGEGPPRAGTVSAAPAGASGDLDALKRRLARLEAEAQARERQIADTRTADLARRAEDAQREQRELQFKLLDRMRDQGRATTPAEKSRIDRELMDMRMKIARSGQELARLRQELETARGDGAPEAGARDTKTAAVTPVPDVTPRPDPNASAAGFDQTDNVRIEGAEIGSFRAPNPDACRNACAADDSCIAYQHGRKIPVMGTCALFSSVTARHEDKSWRSGVRGGGAAADGGARRIPAELSGQRPSRTDQGFQVFEGAMLEGQHIKMAPADSSRACMTVCRNTDGCAAANFMAKTGELGNMCTALSRVTGARTGINGASALIRE